MRDSFDLVMKMGDERVRPFLNAQKLVLSTLFREALTFATEHYNKHGDTRFIAELVGRYNQSTTRRLLTSHIRTHAGLHCSMEDGKVKLAKVIEVERAALPERPALPKRAKKPAPVVAVTMKKKRKTPKRVDALDSWARLPGSYGGGKRR